MDGVKRCRRCEVEKPAGEFRGPRNTCRPCERAEKNAARSGLDRKPVVGVLKICSKCGEEKPCEEFSTDRRASDGRFGWCAACTRTKASLRRRESPELQRAATRKYRDKLMPQDVKDAYQEWYVWRNFGITAEEYNMRRSAVTHCGICNTTEPGKRGWVLDHCHSSGDIREFLCSNCNTGIGLFKDDPDRLLAAAMYLLRHRKTLEKLLPGMARE